MAPKALASPEVIRQCIDYCPETGLLTWKARTSLGVKSAWAANVWNSRNAGNPAGYVNNEGYVRVKFHGKNYAGHRVAWAIFYGSWPLGEVDHINGIRSDNRICNLRDVTRSENQRNAGLRSMNKSGAHGVIWAKNEKKWVVRIRLGEKVKHIGYFTDLEAAIAARKAADDEYGYHPNHGGRQSIPALRAAITEANQ